MSIKTHTQNLIELIELMNNKLNLDLLSCIINKEKNKIRANRVIVFDKRVTGCGSLPFFWNGRFLITLSKIS